MLNTKKIPGSSDSDNFIPKIMCFELLILCIEDPLRRKKSLKLNTIFKIHKNK